MFQIILCKSTISTNKNDNIPNSEGSFDFGNFYSEFENLSKYQSDNDTSIDFLEIEQKNFINDLEKIEFLNISLLTLFLCWENITNGTLSNSTAFSNSNQT
ncbi:hypothetical protein BpHYR1_038035 [Brachionus plicatilis]|uniref:Uncharacterized protein n=1 Tax=Brachionus plicatilis TaxID=10195 RepID=A0A3M7R7C3_BRAPC|nr:hypothetical protein BpHYR1_038035 [Brachionus plicatilis]